MVTIRGGASQSYMSTYIDGFFLLRSPWPTSQTSTRLNPNNTMHFFVAPREFCDIFFRLLACNYFTTSICLTRVILLPTDQLSKKCTIIREIPQTWPYRPYILALFDPRKRGQNFPWCLFDFNPPSDGTAQKQLSTSSTSVAMIHQSQEERLILVHKDSSSGAPSVNKSYILEICHGWLG